MPPSEQARPLLDNRGQRGRVSCIDTGGMTKAAGADTCAAVGVCRYVEDNVIGMRGIAGDSAYRGQSSGAHMIEV